MGLAMADVTMDKFFDIVVIEGSWQGGHHGVYPKVLSVNPESEAPFWVSEGWGHGLGGGAFTLKALVAEGAIELFNRPESAAIYTKIVTAYQAGIDQRCLIASLVHAQNQQGKQAN